MRLALLTTLWGRSRLTEIVLRYYAALRVEGLDLFLVAVRSPEDPDPAPTVGRWHYVEAPNEPLSDKWNAGVAFLEDKEIDAMLIMGSDDLFSVDYLKFVSGLVEGGTEWVRLGSMYFLDVPTGRAAYVQWLNTGGGRVLSESLLEACGWQAWASGEHRNPDGAQNRFINITKKTCLLRDIAQDPALVALGLKDETNRMTFDRLLSYHNPRREVDGLGLLRHHFPDVLTQLSP